MLSRTSRIIIATLAVGALGAAPALAMPSDPTGPADARGEQAASLSAVADARGEQAVSLSRIAHARGEQAVSLSSVADARGEQATSLSGTLPSETVTQLGDLRTEIAREPIQPVVVEVDEPAVSGFDWSAAAIGAAGGLALVLIAGAAVMLARHRPARTMVS